MRTADIRRKTNETDVALSLNLDGAGDSALQMDCAFMQHMLTLLCKNARFDLTLSCAGDSAVDDHHSVEDIGIALGQAFKIALSDARGVTRYASVALPMDEALSLVALDLSGRGTLAFSCVMPSQKVGAFDTELVKEFLLAFVREARVTLHVQALAGENTHHIIESIFKGLGRALRQAVRMDEALGGEIPSTKGVL